MTSRLPRFVLKIVALYVAGALLWIMLSDHLVGMVAGSVQEVTRLSEFKGLLFVGISSLLLYLLLARLARKINAQGARLQEVARRYRTLFEHGGEAMLVVGAADGIIHDANHAAADLYGWPTEALIGRPLDHLVASAPDDLSPDLEARVSQWHRTADGGRIPVDLVSNAMRWQGDSVHLVVVRNLGDQLAQRESLRRLAHQDPLTGLFNRNLLPEQVRMGMSHAQRTGTLFALCFADLDGFKAVNDRLGHDAGDALLCQIAARFKAQVRGGDVVVRLGGDEFVVLLGDLPTLAECEQILRRLLEAIAEPVMLGGEQARVTASIGVALYPNDGRVYDALLRAADEAMYRAKRQGRNRFVFHNKAHEDRIKARGSMLDRVARAIGDRQLALVYAPVIDVTGPTTVGIEAKLRWRHPVLGTVPASDFITFIKDPMLEHEVDLWVIGQVREDMRSMGNHGLQLRINLFAPEGMRDALLEALRPLAEKCGRDRLVVELSAEVVRRMGSSMEAWHAACQAMGVAVSLDGLVAGSDSVHALATLGLDEFKLSAQSIGLGSGGEGVDVLASAYGAMAKAARMRMIVKGVDTGSQLQWLMQHGCTLLQGPVFGAAVDAAHLPELLQAPRPPIADAVSEDQT